MSVAIIRHGERKDYVDKSWVKGAERPWDPPLTKLGKLQAAAAGRRLRDEITRDHGVPTATRVYSSPFTRCVQTATEIAKELGVTAIQVEDGLAEELCEKFYRSWCLPESNGSWGGPPNTTVSADTKLRPQAFVDFRELLHSTATLKEVVSPLVDENYTSLWPLSGKGITWGNFENRSQLVERLLFTHQELHQQVYTSSTFPCNHRYRNTGSCSS